MSETKPTGVQIEIRTLERALPVPKECLQSMKGVMSGKKIAKMKKEALDCPVKGKPISFVECFACKYFFRRVKGKVTCGATEAS